MNQSEDKKTLEEKIRSAITSGEVAMRPRWHFVLKAVLLAVGCVIVFVTVLYLMSLILFFSHENGVVFAPGFGLHGVFIFLRSLPWLLILLSILFVSVLEILVRKYSFGYRKPLLFTLGVSIAIVCIGGVVVAKTPLHGNMMRYTKEHRVPVMGHVYQRLLPPPPRDITKGEIRVFVPSGFVIKNNQSQNFSVHLSPKTRLPRGSEFSVGDIVIVIGHRDGERIEALGVMRDMRP